MKQGRLSLYTVDLKYVRNLANHDKNGNVRSISPQIEKAFVRFWVLLLSVRISNTVFH